jgi:hypothetical protein
MNPFERPDDCICNSLMPGLVNVDPKCPAHGVKPKPTSKPDPVYQPLNVRGVMLITRIDGVDVAHTCHADTRDADGYRKRRQEMFDRDKKYRDRTIEFNLYEDMDRYYEEFKQGVFELGQRR